MSQQQPPTLSEYEKNKQKSKQILILYSKLLSLQQSCWWKFLSFDKSQYFQRFNKKYRIKGTLISIQQQVPIHLYSHIIDIFQLKLQDIIFLFLLALIITTFFTLSTDPNNLFMKAYHIFCIQLFIGSLICLIIKPTIKYLFLAIICFAYPIIMYLIFEKVISIDDTAYTMIYSYMGYMALMLVYLALILVYPLKAIITQSIGTLYGYLYSLSIISLLFLWPLFTICQYFTIHNSLTILIIFNNRPLVITFMIIIICSFYIFVHNTFFQGDKMRLHRILKKLFQEEEIHKALNQLNQEDVKQYENFNVYTRVMSGIVLTTTIGLQLFLFFQMQSSSTNIIKTLSLMVFTIIFLIFGTFYYTLPIKNTYIIPLFTLISITPGILSFIFFQNSLSFWQFITFIFSLPYIILFWSIIRVISIYKPLFQNKILATIYMLIHLPIMVLVMDVYDYFMNGEQIGPVGYVCISIILLVLLFTIIIALSRLIIQLSTLPKQSTKNTQQLDFTYQQPTSTFKYTPYKKLSTFTLSWLSQINLNNIAIFLNSFLFLISITINFYNLNELLFKYQPSYFYSQSIYQIVYAQFVVLISFMLYCHYYICSKNTKIDKIIIIGWVITGVIAIGYSYISSMIPMSFRIIGGYALLMAIITYGFKFLKQQNPKILSFLAPILTISFWILIIIPYSIIIPTFSIYITQSQFGTFIYICILFTVLLLILMVGIVSLIFNSLMDKFQQQKRYKYVIQQVQHFFHQQGIQTNDQLLHVFHQAYQSRNKKYIFYLKKGYPLNIIKDQQTHGYKMVTYDNVNNQNYIRSSKSLIESKKNIIQERQNDCVWVCLTCFCGEDQEDIDEKLKLAIENNLINQDQAENLLPPEIIAKKVFEYKNKKDKKQQKKRIKPQNVNSTKSLLLNTLTQGPRRLGPQFTLLKLQKSLHLTLQIFDTIFTFISNTDKGQCLIIYNDFKKFIQLCSLNLTSIQSQQLFNRHAKTTWGNNLSLNYQEFAVIIEEIADNVYNKEKNNNNFINMDGNYYENNKNKILEQEELRKMWLLIDKVYYNMAKYQQFNQARKQDNHNHNKDKDKQFNIKNSGFNGSLNRYKISLKQRQKQVEKLVRYYKKQKGNLGQPRQKEIVQNVVKINKKTSLQQSSLTNPTGKSCKKTIYQHYQSLTTCCASALPTPQKIKIKQKVKPWSYLSCQAAKILHRKTTLWLDQHQIKQYQFRLIINNFLMALFKLGDLYAYVQITLNDPQVKWRDGAKFSFLLIDYKYQLYTCLALACVTVPLGLKGIKFIFEDSLGLTQTRVPAGFPHPMFFYTVIYKILILSLFSTISTTFLVTFSCTWTQPQPYVLYSDSSISCLSFQHNIYMLLSLIFLIIYFPLSSYTFPNFQFSQKRLDLKFRPSYLVLYFQVNFIIVTNKVLLSLASQNRTVQISYICINIISLLMLSIFCLKIKPCLIEWFNWIEFMVIFLGVIWNTAGLVLYLTKEWILAIVLAGVASGVLVALVVVVVKKGYFDIKDQINQVKQEEFNQIRMNLEYKKKKNVFITNNQNNIMENQIDFQKVTNTIIPRQLSSNNNQNNYNNNNNNLRSNNSSQNTNKNNPNLHNKPQQNQLLIIQDMTQNNTSQQQIKSIIIHNNYNNNK